MPSQKNLRKSTLDYLKDKSQLFFKRLRQNGIIVHKRNQLTIFAALLGEKNWDSLVHNYQKNHFRSLVINPKNICTKKSSPKLIVQLKMTIN